MKRPSLAVVPFFLIVAVPLSVQAGFFAVLLGIEEEQVTEVADYTAHDGAQTVPLLKAAIHADPNPAKGGGDIIVTDGALVPDGGWAESDDYINKETINGEISIYQVKQDDTLSQIAEMFGVSEKTILWANDIRDPDLIQPDVELTILPITGIQHIVKDGESLRAIAIKYGEKESADEIVEDIVAYNQLASADDVSIGDTLIIPGGEAAAPKQTATYTAKPVQTSGVVATGGGSSGYVHPLPGALKTQGIHGYNGVDLAPTNQSGSAIRAAADGEVIAVRNSGWNGGYGLYVVISHPNGTQTLYAHNSSNIVGIGQRVVAGQVIGYVGSTGRSTGTHLHFEVRGARNPAVDW